MRILFVTNRFPGELRHGDQLRAFEQIRHLSAKHEITLLAFDEAPAGSQWGAELSSRCERVIAAPRRRLGTAIRAIAALPGRRPIQVAMYDAVPATVELEALCAASKFDLAHVQLARLGPLLRRLAPLPCVLDFVDALSLNMARRAQFDRTPLGRIARREATRLAGYERTLCAEATLAAICTERDRAAIGDFRNLRVVSNGVDPGRFPFVAGHRRGNDIVFAGNLGYFPNVDAASWFALEAMPLIARRVPTARLKLVGARPAQSLRRIAESRPDIDLLGPVPAVHPHLAAAAVAIAPLRAGSGQQLKILEAMATGTPLVATAQSAGGFDAVSGRDLLVADDAQGMADAVVRLLTDRELGGRIARCARMLVETRYTWELSAAALERLWLEAAGGQASDRSIPSGRG